jgi:hypothetical protein
MKAMTDKEARKWCSHESTGLRVIGRLNILRFKKPKEHYFFIDPPEKHRRIVALARTILCFRGDTQFSGGFLWLQCWDIGSPQLVWPGWRILEDMRRAHGEPRPLEIAPAQSFREDEMVELHAFLIQVIAFAWVADYIPFAGDFFLHFKMNGLICVSARSAETLNELRVHFRQWKQANEDSMQVKMAAYAKVRSNPRLKALYDLK